MLELTRLFFIINYKVCAKFFYYTEAIQMPKLVFIKFSDFLQKNSHKLRKLFLRFAETHLLGFP